MPDPTDQGVSTADLLAKLNAAGVEVPCGKGLLRVAYGECRIYERPHGLHIDTPHDADARNAVTVAALGVVHGAGAMLVPPQRWPQRHTGPSTWAVWMMGPGTNAFKAPDLCAAAVEAAVRVRGGA